MYSVMSRDNQELQSMYLIFEQKLINNKNKNYVINDVVYIFIIILV